MSTHRFRHETATARLVVIRDNLCALRDVYSGTPGQGHARKVMEQVVGFADAHQFDIVITVQRYSTPRKDDFNNTQLEAFYEKFGFERDPLFQNLPRRMIRRHSQELHVP